MRSSTPSLNVMNAPGNWYPAAGLQPILLPVTFTICMCFTTASATEILPPRNHCFKGFQRSKKPTNPSLSSRMALIIPTAAATPFSLRDTDMQTCQKHHHKTSISDICWILIRELVLHTDFNAPWSPSQPPLSKLYLTYIYVTCY